MVLLALAWTMASHGQEPQHWSQLMRNPDLPLDSVEQAFDAWAAEGDPGRARA